MTRILALSLTGLVAVPAIAFAAPKHWANYIAEDNENNNCRNVHAYVG